MSRITGVGTVFQRWNGFVWQSIAEVRAITGPSMEKGVIDVTSLESKEGDREFITGFKQGGEINLAMTFTWETYELMAFDFERQYERNYAILLNDDDGSYIELLGLVSKLPLEIKSDDAVQSNITIKVTGEIIFGTGVISDGIDPHISYVLDEMGDVILDEMGMALLEEV